MLLPFPSFWSVQSSSSVIHEATVVFLCTATVVKQSYVAHVNPEYVIAGNAIVVKCEIPSFVSDFVRVTNWIEETTGGNFYYNENLGANTDKFLNTSINLSSRVHLYSIKLCNKLYYQFNI